MKSTYTSLPASDQYHVIVTRALPRSNFGKVIGIYPGGALRVEIFETERKRTIKKMLPKSCVRT